MKWLKKILKVSAYIILILIFLIGGFYTKAYFAVEERIQKKYNVEAEQLELRTDSTILAEGARLTTVKGCRDCHDNDLGGKNFIDDPLMGTLAARNLTKGAGGLPAAFGTQDWVRVLKHGLRSDSTAV